jgi:hypothetical protein
MIGARALNLNFDLIDRPVARKRMRCQQQPHDFIDSRNKCYRRATVLYGVGKKMGAMIPPLSQQGISLTSTTFKSAGCQRLLKLSPF